MMTNLMTILERKVFISSNPRIVLSSCPPPCGHFSIQESATGGLSYKVKKSGHNRIYKYQLHHKSNRAHIYFSAYRLFRSSLYIGKSDSSFLIISMLYLTSSSCISLFFNQSVWQSFFPTYTLTSKKRQLSLSLSLLIFLSINHKFTPFVSNIFFRLF